MSAKYDYDHNTYIAVTLDPQSSFFSSPSTLSEIHPALTHVGQVGKLKDVQLISFVKADWEEKLEEIIQALQSIEGVIKVDVQEVKDLTKRWSAELQARKLSQASIKMDMQESKAPEEVSKTECSSQQAN
ncbi:hypothetical protein D9758_012951 [Tetrapyrgos nigripes]|uniref:Uncharacterized protein n=1 Tax=Tetrapyrgos nigripes TaxID=182062 RepID=A0A8H5CL83_9AGAR|nr:hypothetical protein D9758_012951 [Tetrapyrgos nigripes]